MNYIINLLVSISVCIGALYIYDQKVVRNYTDFGNLSISDAQGDMRIHIGETAGDATSKYGITIIDSSGKISAFFGVAEGPTLQGANPQVVVYDEVGEPVGILMYMDRSAVLSVGEMNAEKSVLVTADEEAATVTVKGNDDNGIMNEVTLYASENATVAAFSKGNAVVLHTKHSEKSVVAVRNGKRVWESSN